jgi:HEPN domain-containing protein
MLRAVGVDPPKWHDVGQIMLEHTDKFPPALRNELLDFATISRRPRRDREAAFYGDTDLIPEQVFDREAAQQALDEARRVLAGVRHFASDAG